LVPDIPRDITPEELDALSALAAKLDGPISASENIAPTVEKMGPQLTPAAALATPKTEVAKTEVPKTAVDAPAAAADAKKEVETPVPVAEAAVEVHPHETERPEAQHPEMPAAAVAGAVNTAPFAQEPAPVDKNDEQMFATAANAVGQAGEEKIEAKPAEAVAVAIKIEAAEASAPEAVAAKDKGSKPEALEADEPAPSDEALAEAFALADTRYRERGCLDGSVARNRIGIRPVAEGRSGKQCGSRSAVGSGAGGVDYGGSRDFVGSGNVQHIRGNVRGIARRRH